MVLIHPDTSTCTNCLLQALRNLSLDLKINVYNRVKIISPFTSTWLPKKHVHSHMQVHLISCLEMRKTAKGLNSGNSSGKPRYEPCSWRCYQ